MATVDEHESINEWCERMPMRQYSYQVKGWVLYFPRTGLVMVPANQVHHGWECVVVKGNATYPVGGYDLFVGDREIERAVRVDRVGGEVTDDK